MYGTCGINSRSFNEVYEIYKVHVTQGIIRKDSETLHLRWLLLRAVIGRWLLFSMVQLRLIVESETHWHNNNKKTIWCWWFFHWRDKQCDVRAMQRRFYFSVCHVVLKMESDYNLYCIHTFPLHLSSKYGWFTRVATTTVITMHGPQGGARAPLNARCSGWIYPKSDCFKQEKRLTSLTGIYSMDNINTDQEMHLA